MSKLAIKYAGCQDTADNLKNISSVKYEDLINDLTDVLNSLNNLTYKPDTSQISNSIKKARENQEKLMNFANALENYARDLYEFDNTFYENFVSLDGTNLDNYKNNIGNMEISDDEIERIFFSDKNSLERYLYLLSKSLRDDYNSTDNSLIKQIEKKIFRFCISPEKMKALKFLLKGNSFKIIKRGEKIFIKLKSNKLNVGDLKKCAEYLHNEFNILSDKELEKILNDHSSKQLNRFVNRISNEYIEIYNRSSGKWTKYAKKTLTGEFADLNKYIKSADLSDIGRGINTFKNAAKDDFLGAVKYFSSSKPIEELKNVKISSKINFFGKALGGLDKVKTLYDNANSDLKDANGNWYLSNGKKNREFVIDTAVDLGSSAGASGLGAALGTFLCPGAGTVVGATTAAGISILINHKFIGKPPKSIVDKTKDIANEAADKAEEAVNNAAGSIYNYYANQIPQMFSFH